MVTRTVISMFHWTFALGLLVLRSCAHITPEPPTNLPDNVECDETPPDCNASHQVIGGLPYTFKSRDHGYVQPVRHELHINTQEPICSLDPTVFVTDTSNRSTPLNLHFQIGCHQMSTRVVIRPTRNLTSALVFAFIEIRNCIIYWKDLSTFGRYVDLRAMLFFNWVDEFVAQQPSFFQQCVELDDLQPGVDGVAPSISDLARVASLLVASSPTCSLPHDTPAHTSSATSPVFTRHMWPLMAGVKFMGYSVAFELLPKTMPKLQALIFLGLGRLPAPAVEFPWQQETLLLPLNMSRTITYNDQYSSDLALPTLPPNIFRRLLKLDAVVIPPVWNKTFTGFLHKIQVTRCKLTHVDSDMFIHTKGLQSIDISQNQIAELNDQPFSGLTNLVTINLENNLLLSLPEGIFDGLASLENILLRGNHLTSIDAMTFRNLHSLNRIDISQNNLSHISEDAMGLETSDFTQLKHMHLSQNNLEDFPLWLLQLEVLADIDLSHNRLSFERLKLVLSRIPNTEFLSYNNGQGSRHNNNYFLPATEKTIKFRNNSFTNFDLSLLVDEELVNFLLLLNYFQLDFSGNNFTCECDIYSLYNYLRNFDTAEFRDYNQIGILPYNMNNIICQQPVDLQGVPLVEAPVTSLGCYEEIPGCPRDCQCWVRTVDEVVKVICRNKTLTELPESLPHNTTELDFSGNLLTSLPQDVPDYFSSVDILDFSENVLTHLDGSLFKILKNTWKLNLHGNYLTILPAEVEQMSKTLQLTLSGNRFICDCTTLWLKQWLLTRRRQILDIDQIICATGVPQGQTVIEIADVEFVCVTDMFPIIVSVSTVAAILALILIVLLLIYKYRGEIKIILYMKFGWHPFDCSDDSDIIGKEFDVFVSYCHDDHQWVYQELWPRLETSQPPFRLCLHERDFVGGAAVADNISAAINTSRRMVLLLSRAFLRSHWCYLEFRQAHYKVLKDRTNYLIVVLCEDVSAEDLDEDMHLYLKTNTYLSRDCHWFWEKLRYALPQKPLAELQKGKETKWKDGWSGVEALAEAQNEARRKAIRKSQLRNGEKKHCCQYRKPEYWHAIEDEKDCNKGQMTADPLHVAKRQNDQCIDLRNYKDQGRDGKNGNNISIAVTNDLANCIIKRDNVGLNVDVSDSKNRANSAMAVIEVTKF